MSTTMDENQEAPTRKPEAQPGTNYVNVKVNGQDGSEVYFRICKRTQLSKLMKGYCKRQALELRTIAFLLDGHAIAGNQTADEVVFFEPLLFLGFGLVFLSQFLCVGSIRFSAGNGGWG
ncbi:small ubiquitin-related modifier 1-like isoform X1 [Cucurbita maxima]|uniref:Small ubiquitin-related modifier 1-like isoform X1 n=1 Tax=Cucurbita maxima TaxID=3661 RepID=A0A6J1HW85_CUCMA|nr:small ubiquitin-related modifier 1-like isoform X1 [Cucurbita maxima]